MRNNVIANPMRRRTCTIKHKQIQPDTLIYVHAFTWYLSAFKFNSELVNKRRIWAYKHKGTGLNKIG